MRTLNNYQTEKALRKGLYLYEIGESDEDGMIPLGSFAFKDKAEGAHVIYDMIRYESAYKYADVVRLKKADKRYRDLKVNEKALGIVDLQAMAGIPAWEM